MGAEPAREVLAPPRTPRSEQALMVARPDGALAPGPELALLNRSDALKPARCKVPVLGGFQLDPGGVYKGGNHSFPHPEPPSSAHPISAPTPAANAARCPPQKFPYKGSHQLSPALIHRKPFAPLPGPKQRHPARGGKRGKERSHKKPAPTGIYLGSPGVRPAAPHPAPTAKFIVSLRGIPGKSPK